MAWVPGQAQRRWAQLHGSRASLLVSEGLWGLRQAMNAHTVSPFSDHSSTDSESEALCLLCFELWESPLKHTASIGIRYDG